MRRLRILFGGVLLAASPLALANPIFYEVENIEDNQWKYNYTVGNETDAPIDWFTIWFDPELYEFDTVGSGDDVEADPESYVGPAEWDIIVAVPTPLLPGPDDDQFGLYDGFTPLPDESTLGRPVDPGSRVSGFSMIFTWLGTGMPGKQPFTLGGDWLPTDLFTEPLAAGPVPVPEPGTLGLLGAAFALLGFCRRMPSRGRPRPE